MAVTLEKAKLLGCRALTAPGGAPATYDIGTPKRGSDAGKDP